MQNWTKDSTSYTLAEDGVTIMNILVIGATGSFAGLVEPELKNRGVTVRALVRADDRVPEALRRADAVVIGDLRSPATLRAATQGADGVFHMNPAFAPGEAEMGVAMVQAVESGMDNTIVQPAMFMQMLEGLWSEAVRTGEITVAYSNSARVCYVDDRDVAEEVALAFTDDAPSCGTFELPATGMFNRVQLAALISDALAALISDALGRTIRAGEMSPHGRPKIGAAQ